ncbi:phenylacetate--CoA ligase family protein [Anaerosinus sp.]
MTIIKEYLRDLYSLMPDIVQKGIDFVYGKIPNDVKFGNEYSKMISLLNVSQKWSREEKDDYVLSHLKHLFIHAYETTPYYRRNFKKYDFDPYRFDSIKSLEMIPTIDKKTVQDNINDMLSTSFPKSKRIKCTTGGTTGNQMIFYLQKNFSIAREKAYFDYLFRKMGYVNGKSTMAVLRNDILPKECLWRYDYRRNSLILNPYCLTDENMHLIVQKLNSEKIEYFHVYPSSIVLLCDYIRRSGDSLDYRPKAVFASSENVYPGQKELVESILDCKFLIHYGHSEMGGVAGWCCKYYHYHIEPIYGYIELLNQNGLVISDSGIRGEIVTTGFNNYVLPLIRYKTADFARYENSVNDCDYRTLSSIEGRWMQEHLIGEKGNKVSMTALNMHSEIFDNVVKYQFYQDTVGKCILNIVKGDGYTLKDESIIYSALNAKLGNGFQLKIKYVSNIEASKSGKFRYIIQKII